MCDSDVDMWDISGFVGDCGGGVCDGGGGVWVRETFVVV